MSELKEVFPNFKGLKKDTTKYNPIRQPQISDKKFEDICDQLNDNTLYTIRYTSSKYNLAAYNTFGDKNKLSVFFKNMDNYYILQIVKV